MESDVSAVSSAGFSLDYHFTEREVRILAKLFRNNQERIPDGLLDFAEKIEKTIYDSMSITEAEYFYS